VFTQAFLLHAIIKSDLSKMSRGGEREGEEERRVERRQFEL